MTLQQLFDGLDVTAGPLAVHTLCRDGAVDGGQIDGPTMHYVVRGAGRLEIAEGESVGISARTVIVVPPRRRTRIIIPAGACRIDVVIACVPIRATYKGSIGLFDQLHEPLLERVSIDDSVRRSFEDLLDEFSAHRPGCRAMSETIVRRCLIWLLRRCFDRGEYGLPWLAPLMDTRLACALTAMYERPQHCFTLGELAELSGMSRSAFAARFAQVLGQSPIECLKVLRLARAAQLLTGTDLPVKGIAGRVGYSSRSSFTRAFCARHGLAPALFRSGGQRPPAKTVVSGRPGG